MEGTGASLCQAKGVQCQFGESIVEIQFCKGAGGESGFPYFGAEEAKSVASGGGCGL